MAENVVNGREVTGMITHWLKTPVNGYLGSTYGSEIQSLLQDPQSAVKADSLFDKLKEDVEILQVLPDNAVNLYSEQSGFDTTRLFIETFDNRINLDEVERRS
jgi:hypothetical protein